MKTVVKGVDLASAVLKVVKAVSAKPLQQILEGIKLTAKGDTLILLATDMEIAIEKTIIANTFKEGTTVVSGRLFAEFVKKLETEDDIELSINDDGKLKISYSQATGYLQTYNAEDFPLINSKLSENSFLMKQKDFKEIINMTAFACSQDDSRPVLKGCLLEVEDEVMSLVALDGFRLAVCKKRVKEVYGNIKAIIPCRALLEITRLIENEEEYVTVVIQENLLMVNIDNTVFVTRLFDGTFIDYKKIVPKTFVTNFRVNRMMLIGSVERASIISRSLKNTIKFDVKENYLYISAESELGNVNENVIINLEGMDLSILFNSRYILDALKVIGDEFVNFNFNSSIAPCVIKPYAEEDEEYMYLILPLRNEA